MRTRLKGIETQMTDEQINHMVTRFLAWKLPDDFAPDGSVHPMSTPAPIATPEEVRASREAIIQLAFAAWCALDNAEETEGGYVLDRGDADEVAKALDALAALVPESEQPFGGGFPARYLWDRALASSKAEIERVKAERDEASRSARTNLAAFAAADARNEALTDQVGRLREALKPFADAYSLFEPERVLHRGHFAAARAALSPTEPDARLVMGEELRPTAIKRPTEPETMEK